MKSKRKVLLIILGSVLFCCIVLAFAPCPPTYMSQWGDTPMPITHISPIPNSEISLGCYTRKNLRQLLHEFIGLSINLVHPPEWVEDGGITVNIAGPGITSTDKFSELHTLFYLDGQGPLQTWEWTQQTASLNYPNLTGQYVYVANPFLLPGDHTAKIILLLSPSQEIFREYEWHFRITWW